jgi:anti-sigma B factor antagonist
MIGYAMTVSAPEQRIIRLVLSGEIDLAIQDQLLHGILTAVRADEADEVVVDLGQVTFLSCSGMGILIAGRNAAAVADRPYHVIGAQGLVRRVLDLTGLLTFLDDGAGARAEAEAD